jgi:hypothetical protein
VRQARADDDERRARLRELVARRAQRRDVVHLEVLHLVDEQGDADADVGGELGHHPEQLDEVDLDVPGVGPAGAHRGVDAGLPAVLELRVGRGGPQRERLEDAEGLLDAVRGAVADGEVAHGAVQRGRERAAQVGVRAGLDLARAPTGADGHRAQLAQKHRLADPAQPGQHEAALRTTARHPLEHHVERGQLLVAAGQLGRALTGAGSERVAHRVHAIEAYGSL